VGLFSEGNSQAWVSLGRYSSTPVGKLLVRSVLVIRRPVSVMNVESLTITPEQAGQTLAALLRARSPGLSWNDARRRVLTRHVKIGGELCLDPARRVKEGEVIEFLARPAPKPHAEQAITIVYLDEHLIVVEKPSGLSTVRHPS